MAHLAFPLTVAGLVIIAAILYVFTSLHFRLKRIETMPVSPAAQAIVDELNTAATSLPQITGAAAQASEDLGAIKTAADALSQAIAAAIPAPVQPQ